MDTTTILILAVVGILAIVLMVVLLRIARRQKLGPLPDGDYEIEVESTQEGLQGDETVYVVRSPGAFKGRRVRIKESK